MQRGLWCWTRKVALWHEMFGDVKMRRLVGTFYIRLHWPLGQPAQWGHSFYWHLVCSGESVSESGHSLNTASFVVAPIGPPRTDGGFSFFCATILHSMVGCPAGRVYLRRTYPTHFFLHPHWPWLQTGQWGHFSWHWVCIGEPVE